MNNNAKLECSWCGEELSTEEAESPRLDSSDDVMCDECYTRHYRFVCAMCEEYADNDGMGDIGRMFVVMEETAGSHEPVEPGLYVIVEHPYFADGMIEGYLFNNALESIGDVPEGMEAGYYPCAHLCEECEEELRKELEPNNV